MRPNIGLKVATLRPMFRFGKVTHTYLASTSPGLNVVWPQRRLASTSSGLNVVWPHCRWPQRRGLKVAWPQCPIGIRSSWSHWTSVHEHFLHKFNEDFRGPAGAIFLVIKPHDDEDISVPQRACKLCRAKSPALVLGSHG